MTKLKVTSLNFMYTPKSGPYSEKKEYKLSLYIKGKLCNVKVRRESDGCTDKPLLQTYSDFFFILILTNLMH